MNWLIVLVLASAAISCVATDVGNPEGEVDVELAFSGYEQTRSNALTLASDTRIEAAWVVLSRIRLQQADRCDEDGAFDVDEPIVVDLLADEPNYQAPIFTKPSGGYCKLDIGFASVDVGQLPADAPAELAERSVLIEGERSDGVAFRITARFDDLFRLNGQMQSFKIDDEQRHLLVGFALDEWLNEPRLDTIRGEDPIVIDEDNHAQMLPQLRAAIRRSARLFGDRNHNRRLDADERDGPIARGAER